MSGSLPIKGIFLLAAAVGLTGTFAMAGIASSADAATGANFIATGHDMDLHCFSGTTEECAYLKIVVDKVRNGSTLPILALDQGTELPTALADAGYTGAGEVVTVNPAETAAFNATAFVDASGHPLYSAIVTASDETCGGCDNTEAGEANINARASDFETYFDGGGGILALAGASHFETYYNFVPLKVGATVVAPPFTVTPEGAKLGISEGLANCCATHNSFSIPPSPFVVLEADGAGNAETIAAFGTSISKSGFGAPTTLTTTLSGGGQSGATITVAEGTPVADTATLGGVNASIATGVVSYTVYADSKCEKQAASAGSGSVSGGVVVGASEAKTLAAGTYYWQASYGGDPGNLPSKSTCGSEVETVLPAAKKEVLPVKVQLSAPVLGKTVNVEVISGIVFIKLPAGAHLSLAMPSLSAFESASKGVGFIPLTEARQIPVGSTLDTTAGVARLTTATATIGNVQFGDFGAGIFTILQSRKQRGLTDLNIVNNESSRQLCTTTGKRALAASRHLSSQVLGRLNGSAHGKFTTRGQYSAATVRGTIWSVANRCDGTFTQVSRGVVSVRDFVRRKSITLTAGQHYLAKAR